MRSLVAQLLRLQFRNPRGHGHLSLASVVCCQVEVPRSDRSLVQRSPTECGVFLFVIKCNINLLQCALYIIGAGSTVEVLT